METSPNEEVKPGFALPQWWIAHPMIGFIGTLASVIGLGIYLYAASKPTRELIITSDPPVTIVRGGQASSVDVLYHGNKITTDVYARQLYVWNAGSESIRGDNILEPIGIVIPHATILETRIKKLSRPLTKISAKIDGADRITLLWTILEHNDGAAIDIVYASPDASQLIGKGIVEHQPEIRVREYESARKIVLQGWQRTFMLWLLAALATFLVVFVLWLVNSLVAPKQKLDIGQVVFGYFFVGLGLFMAAAVFWLVFTSVRADVMPPVF